MKLGFGLMRLPLTRYRDEIDINLVKAMVDVFIAQGGTYFDTAYVYHGGKSEEVFRQAVSERYAREEFQIADKLWLFTLSNQDDMLQMFETSLARCGVSYFDNYLLHTIGAETYEMAENLEAFAFLQQEKTAGRIKHIGFSYHDNPVLLDEILEKHPEVEFVQLQINYVDWESSEIASRQCYEIAVRHGKKVIVMEPLKGGLLVRVPEKAAQLLTEMRNDWAPARWGICFPAGLPETEIVLSGMNSLEQIKENLAWLKDDIHFSEKELKGLEAVKKTIVEKTTIPCTGCGYCMETCPKKVNIPRSFAIRNEAEIFGYRGEFKNYYANMLKVNGAPKDCIQCGECKEHCPQHLEIPKLMHECANKFQEQWSV